MHETNIHGGRISEDMLFILRALADEVKTTVVDTLNNIDKSFSVAQSRQFPPHNLAASSAAFLR
jgi:hypothetical protein